MGLLDFMSGGLTAATEAASGQQKGQMEGSQILRAIMAQSLAMQEKQAQIRKTDADTQFSLHRNKAPVLGEDGYNSAKAGEAGAVAGATAPIDVNKAVEIAGKTAPIHTQQAIDTARGVEPIHTQGAINTEAGKAPIEVNKATQIAENTGKIGLQAGKAFVSSNKALTDAIQPYALAKDMLRAAKSGNPAALKSATMAFAGVADPKARLTQGVINMISQVDPSVSGRLDLAMDRLASGKLPPRVIDDIERIVDQVHQTHRAMYDQRRKAAIARQPQVEQAIPTTEELFDVPGYGVQPPPGATPSSGSTADSHPVVSKYGITPSRP